MPDLLSAHGLTLTAAPPAASAGSAPGSGGTAAQPGAAGSAVGPDALHGAQASSEAETLDGFGAMLERELDVLAVAPDVAEEIGEVFSLPVEAPTEADVALPVSGNGLPFPGAPAPDAEADAVLSDLDDALAAGASPGRAGAVAKGPALGADRGLAVQTTIAGGAVPGDAPVGEGAEPDGAAGVRAAITDALSARADVADQPRPAADASASGLAAPVRAQMQAAPVPGADLAHAPGSARWSEGLGERVMWMVEGKHQFAELRLTPPELGRLDVRISLSGSEASIQFSAPTAAVREAVDAALPRLREMLAEGGLSLAHADVADHGHHGANEDGARDSGGTGGVPGAGPGEHDRPALEGPLASAAARAGLLDQYA